MIDTTGQCSACGQTVGIDTIHTCSPQVTAPTPERRVGEAEARIWCSSLEPAVRDLARDLLDERAANASLTAEVERLRGALVKVRAHTAHTKASPDELHIGLLASIERIADAALSLPTPAPEARK